LRIFQSSALPPEQTFDAGINFNNLRENFHRVRQRAKVSKCTLHDLRRSAITNWASRLPIQVVQQLAGHSDISTTRKYYLTVRSEDKVSANKVVNSILAKASAK
jgi:integrase